MPFCNQCGTQNPENSAFCCSCGAPLAPHAQPGYAQSSYSNTPTRLPAAANITGIFSMVCGLISCGAPFFGFLFSIPALILSGIARSKTPGNLINGKAKTGLITGIIGIVLSVFWWTILIASL